MTPDPQTQRLASYGLAAAGALWPSFMCAVRDALAQGGASAWCGAPPAGGQLLLGHGLACWAGALFLLTMALLAHSQAVPARRRA